MDARVGQHGKSTQYDWDTLDPGAGSLEFCRLNNILDEGRVYVVMPGYYISPH